MSLAYAMQPPPAGAKAGATGGSGAASFMQFLPFVLIFVVFYFLLIRPQQKKMKAHKALLDSVEKGDEIILDSGMHGKVVGIAENIMTVEIADNVRVKYNKDRVALKKKKPSAE